MLKNVKLYKSKYQIILEYMVHGKFKWMYLPLELSWYRNKIHVWWRNVCHNHELRKLHNVLQQHRTA